MSERNRSAVEKDFIDRILRLTEVEYTILTPDSPRIEAVSCRANDETFLRDIFPFNSQYAEHLFFISYCEKLEENTDSWFYIKFMLSQLWQIRIELHNGDPHNPGYEFCFSIDSETHDIRIQDRRQLRGRVYKLQNQYVNGKIDDSIKAKLEGACSNILQAIDNYECLFGTALRAADQLDIAFGFLISDELMRDLINEYPFKPESSCVTCIRIKKWPKIEGDEKDRSNITLTEGTNYKEPDGDSGSVPCKDTEVARDKMDIPDDRKKNYGGGSEISDVESEKGDH